MIGILLVDLDLRHLADLNTIVADRRILAEAGDRPGEADFVIGDGGVELAADQPQQDARAGRQQNQNEGADGDIIGAGFHLRSIPLYRAGATLPSSAARPRGPLTVSYTHLTLPTIYSV